MPSSTFSSDRIVRGRWWQTWALAGVLAFTTVLLLETGWRRLGHVPVVNDGKELWSWYRRDVYSHADRTFALVGRSRLLGGFWTDGFRKQFPDHQLVQLAVAGAKVLPIFRDLAEDENFRGTILCSIMEYDLAHPEDTDHPWLDYDRQRRQQQNGWLSHWEFGIRHSLQQCVSLNPRTSLRSAWRQLYDSGSLPAPAVDESRFDRCRYYDFSDADLKKLTAARLAHNPPGKLQNAKRWLQQAKKIEPYVAAIMNRGGRVVFIRYPTTGEYQRRTEVKYPRREFWDQFAASTAAAALHFEDVAEMRRFVCPDGSHLDIRDVPAFTQILLQELVRRGILPGNSLHKDDDVRPSGPTAPGRSDVTVTRI